MAEIEKASKDGLDPAYFSRSLKAAYGKSIRALSSFAGLCASMADADFGAYDFLSSFAILGGLTAEEARMFIREQLRPERFAMSVIRPVAAPEDF